MAKVERLELLYAADGRSNRQHPLRGLYTGLAITAPSAQESGTAALLTAAASAGKAEQPIS